MAKVRISKRRGVSSLFPLEVPAEKEAKHWRPAEHHQPHAAKGRNLQNM
jgi:hypothetical protein